MYAMRVFYFIIAVCISSVSRTLQAQQLDGESSTNRSLQIFGYLEGYYAHYSDQLPSGQFQKFPTSAQHSEITQLHKLILSLLPNCIQHFKPGVSDDGKTIHNPTLCYGELDLPLSGGKTRKTFQIGLTINATGLSIHVMGLLNKSSLKELMSHNIGKASITGYCLRIKTINDISLEALSEGLTKAIQVQRS